MQISIARMKDIDGSQSGRIGFVIHQLQHFGECPLWNHRVLDQEVRAELAHQATGNFAGFPKSIPLRLIVTVFNTRRAGGVKQLRNCFHAGLEQHCRTIDLCDQQKSILRQSDGHRTVFHHGHAAWIHQFDGDRERSMGGQSMNCPFGRLKISKCGAVSPCFLRARQQSQPEARERAERSFGADHQTLPVLSPCPSSSGWSTEPMHAAVQ